MCIPPPQPQSNPLNWKQKQKMVVWVENWRWGCAKSLQSCLTLCDPMDLSLTRLLCPREFSRQEYWSGLPCPPPGALPNPGIKSKSLKSPELAGRYFTTTATWEMRTVANFVKRLHTGLSLAAQIQCVSEAPHMRLVALGAVPLPHLLCLPTACHAGPWQLLSGWFCSRLSTWPFLLLAAGTPVPDTSPQASVVSCCLKSRISALFWCTRPSLAWFWPAFQPHLPA